MNNESGKNEPKYAIDQVSFLAGSALEIIGDRAFYGRAFRFFLVNDTGGFIGRIILPDSLKRIGKDSFNMCSGIERFSIPESVSYIGESFCDRTTVVLDVVVGSYAALYAEENGYMMLNSYDQDTSWLND